MKDLNRIMLVEDDPDIAMLATMALQDFGGFSVTHCASGEEALSRVRAIDPDLAILDYSMPGMKGDQLLTALRSDPATRGIVALFMTASVMPAHVDRLKSLGAVEVIKKPFDPIGLSDRVRQAWEKAHSSQRR